MMSATCSFRSKRCAKRSCSPKSFAVVLWMLWLCVEDILLPKRSPNPRHLPAAWCPSMNSFMERSNRSMHIVYFYQYFSTPAGSWGTRVYEFARRWVEAGDRVTVVTAAFEKSDIVPDGFLTKLQIAGIDVRVINIPLSNKHGIAARLGTYVGFAVIASLYALLDSADVVICSSGPITVGLPALLSRYGRRRPLVFEVRDLWPQAPLELGAMANPIAIAAARRLERACYHAANAVVTLSPGMTEWIKREQGIHWVHTVTNASDTDLMNTIVPASLPEWAQNKKLVLYTGTLGIAHGCSQIVDLARELRRRDMSDIEIVIIGDGRDRADLQLSAQRENLTNLHFLGLKPRDETLAWLKRASVSLIVLKNRPVLSTSSPNKLFDSFAAGVPVVQTTTGWMSELMDQEGCGLNAEPDNPSSVADTVIRLCTDISLWERVSKNDKRVARGRFDRDQLSHVMHDIVHRAAHGVVL